VNLGDREQDFAPSRLRGHSLASEFDQGRRQREFLRPAPIDTEKADRSYRNVYTRPISEA
jgi:hypothetical protein